MTIHPRKNKRSINVHTVYKSCNIVRNLKKQKHQSAVHSSCVQSVQGADSAFTLIHIWNLE